MLAVSAVAEALESVVWPDTVRLEAVVVARVVVPDTSRVPLDTRDEVAVREPNVADPPVREEIAPVTALSKVEKRLVEVLLVEITDENVGVSVNVYSTCPSVVVARERLLFVDDARKV